MVTGVNVCSSDLIFILEDCTGDLMEAQDISWWAGLGRAWVASIEKEGRTWRREEDALPEGFAGQAWPCEWEGRFLGWLCVEKPTTQADPAASDGGEPDAPPPIPMLSYISLFFSLGLL